MFCLKSGRFDPKKFDFLGKSLEQAAKTITDFKFDTLGEDPKQFKIYDTFNIACIVCKVVQKDLIVVHANRKFQQFKLRYVIGKSLKKVLSSKSELGAQAWSYVEKFVENRLPFVEFYGHFEGGSFLFKCTGHWVGERVIFNITPTQIST